MKLKVLPSSFSSMMSLLRPGNLMASIFHLLLVMLITVNVLIHHPLLSSSLFVEAANTYTQANCGGGQLHVTGETGILTFNGPISNCDIKVSASPGLDKIIFNGILTSCNVTVEDTTCSQATGASKTCISFSQNLVSMGDIIVRNVHMDLDTSTANGDFIISNFDGSVDSNSTTSVSNSSLTGHASGAGAIVLKIFHVTGTISNARLLEVSGNSAVVQLSSTGGAVRLYILLSGGFTNVFEFQLTSNKIAALASASSDEVRVVVAYPSGAIDVSSSSLGSVFNVSSNYVSGTFNASSIQRVFVLWFGAATPVSSYERFLFSKNTFENIAASAGWGSSCTVRLARIQKTFALSGTADASFVMENNALKNITATSALTSVNVNGIWFEAAVSQISSFRVSNLDMSDVNVDAATWAHFGGVYFLSTLTMNDAGSISVSDVHLSGSVDFGGMSGTPTLVGARIVNFGGALTSVKSISLSDSSFDFNSISSAGGTLPIKAYILQVGSVTNLEEISVVNNSIRGSFLSSGASSEIELKVVRIYAASSGILLLNFSRNVINPTLASATGTFVTADVVEMDFSGTLTGSAGGSDSISYTNNRILGTYNAGGTYVCTGVAFLGSGVSVSGFESITIENSLLNYNATENSAYGGSYNTVDSVNISCGNRVALFYTVGIANYFDSTSAGSVLFAGQTFNFSLVDQLGFSAGTVTPFSGGSSCGTNPCLQFDYSASLSSTGAGSSYPVSSSWTLPSSYSPLGNANLVFSVSDTAIYNPNSTTYTFDVRAPATVSTVSFPSSAVAVGSWFVFNISASTGASPVLNGLSITPSSSSLGCGSNLTFSPSSVTFSYGETNPSQPINVSVSSSITEDTNCTVDFGFNSTSMPQWLQTPLSSVNLSVFVPTTTTTTTTSTTSTTTSTTTTTTNTSTTTTSTTLPSTSFPPISITTQAPPTVAPTTLVGVSTYAPIPPGLTQYGTSTAAPALPPGSFGVLNDARNLTNIVTLVATLNTSSPPMSVTLSTATPELGSFIVVPENLDPSVTYTLSDAADNITFTSSTNNATALSEAVKNGFVFNPSLEALARNLTQDKYYIRVVAKDNATELGATTIFMSDMQENINTGPETVYTDPNDKFLSLNVSRGHKFDLDLGNVFTHKKKLRMHFGIADAAGFPLPVTMRVACTFNGVCAARGALDILGPLRIEIRASDSYIARSAYLLFHINYVAIHPSNVTVQAIELRPGTRFSYALASNLFFSSTRVEYTALTLADGFPLPFGSILFDPPYHIRGIWMQPVALQLQLKAEDLFGVSSRNFTLNFTNTRPLCNLSSVVGQLVIAPVAALQEFTREVDLTALCSDPDGDAIEFSVSAALLPSWLRADILPGGGPSVLPQKLRLSGKASLASENSNIQINITVREFFASQTVAETVRLPLDLQVLKNTVPLLTTPLPNITVTAGERVTRTIVVSQFFSDPQGDALTPTVVSNSGFVSLTIIASQPNPQFTVDASPPEDAEEQTVSVQVFVIDALGARSSTHSMSVTVVRTLWQKIQDYVYLAIGLLGLVTTVLTSFWWIPFIYNTCRRKSKIIPCPLSAEHPEHIIPLDTVTCTYHVRDKSKYTSFFIALLPGFWADEITFIDTFDGEVPPWLQLAEYKLKLAPYDSGVRSQMPIVTFRCFSRHGFILEQFDVDYEQATKGWNFDQQQQQQQEGAGENNNLEKPFLAVGSGSHANEILQKHESKFQKQEAEMQQQSSKIAKQESESQNLRSIIARMLKGEKVDASEMALLGPSSVRTAASTSSTSFHLPSNPPPTSPSSNMAAIDMSRASPSYSRQSNVAPPASHQHFAEMSGDFDDFDDGIADDL